MIESITIITLAYILDLLFGDPRWLPHPAKLIGYLAKKTEAILRNIIRNQRMAGVIFAILIIGTVYVVSITIISTANHFNHSIGFILSVVLIYTSLAIKDLRVEGMRVYRALESQDVGLARKNLSLIVGRDTTRLDDREIVRATVETIAENIVDGIISPLFYAFLGGAPLALAYKAVNTLDSMVGYKNERYKDFGWASAKIDDCLNFIPARLSVLILPIASWLLGLDVVGSFKIALRDGKKNPSPNSGIPEAAMAGALGVRLGGLNYYNSVATVKPLIGNENNGLNLSHIKKSIKVAYVSSLLALILGVSIRYNFYMGR